jgi:hypothetical protein
LQIDSNNYTANYEIARIHYNKAVIYLVEYGDSISHVDSLNIVSMKLKQPHKKRHKQ